MLRFFFFNDTATTEIYTLSLHDALPISNLAIIAGGARRNHRLGDAGGEGLADLGRFDLHRRSEEHTSELQSH